VTFVLEPRGPFTLASAARFIAGWPPTARREATGAESNVRLAFLVDDWSGHVGVELRQDREHGPVQVTVVESTTTDSERVRAQAARIVSLDHDGTGYGALGEREAVVARLAPASGWLRPVLFHSPYEAACWAVISTRLGQPVATRVRDGLSRAHGGAIRFCDEEFLTFPAPERLLAVREALGLPAVKLERLHAIARAALEGRLDRERLLAADPDEALARLRELPGIGPFWSKAILLRAVGTTDVLASGERRVRERAAAVYAAPQIAGDEAAFAALAERWRPFRTWVSVLLRVSS